MITLKVPDMHCENCVRRVTNALNDAGLKFSVSLEDKTVEIDGCENCAAKAREAIEEIGFSAE
jgi:copper chaperone CopZ